MRKNKDGFTLIELMIVIAIIAIIAAIAIPGLLASQRASNERSASSSLKTVATAEADFRANDRDSNKIQDFYTDDLSGLYGLLPVASTEPVKLIELSVAGADFTPQGAGASGATGINVLAVTVYAINAPKAGYWFRAMTTDEDGSAYQQNTGGVADTAGAALTSVWFNTSKFGFMAFPDSFSSGRHGFFLNENNTIFKRPANGPCKPASTTGALAVGSTGLVGSQVAETWPEDSVLRTQYSKID